MKKDNKMNDRKVKNDILLWFITNFPNAATWMKQTSHYFSPTIPNKYHLEDSVWTHSLLVLKEMDGTGFTNLETKFLFITALTHDYGKCIQRHVNVDKQRVHFYSHPFSSVQFHIDVITKYILTEVPDGELELEENNIERIMNDSMTVVANHDEYYRCKDSLNLSNLLNKSESIFQFANEFSRADSMGKFFINTDDNRNKEVEDKFTDASGIIIGGIPSFKMKEIENMDAVIYCGVPGSGKDTIAESNNHKVFSLDIERLEYFKSTYPELLLSKIETEKEKYNLAFKQSQRVNLTDKLKQRFINYMYDSTNGNRIPAICNTHLKIKSRKPFLKMLRELLPGGKIGCVFVYTSSNNCKDRDSNRTDKTVGKHVIDKFSLHIEVPTLQEGFDAVYYIPT